MQTGSGGEQIEYRWVGGEKNTEVQRTKRCVMFEDDCYRSDVNEGPEEQKTRYEGEIRKMFHDTMERVIEKAFTD